MITPCLRSTPFIHTDLPMATASPHRHSAAVAFRIVAAAMGGTPTLLNLMDTMFPPQMRQIKINRTTLESGTWEEDLGFIFLLFGFHRFP